MGNFVLNLDEPTEENLLKTIRANLDLYEKQNKEYGNAYLLRDFAMGYLKELIELEEAKPSNWDWNQRKTRERNKEIGRKCPKCKSYDLTIKLIDITEYHRQCQDCGYHGPEEKFKKQTKTKENK